MSFSVVNNFKQFNFQDIENLKYKTVGLRHLSSPLDALYEVSNGVEYGCSFNLSFLCGNDGSVGFSRLPRMMEPIDLQKYNDAILHNIRNSLEMDLRGSLIPGVSKVKEVFQKVKDSSFLLIDYANTGFPVDLCSSTYGGAGRFPKMPISSEKIHGTILFDEGACSSITDFESEEVITRESGDVLVDCIAKQYQSQVVELLRVRSKDFQDDRIALLSPEDQDRIYKMVRI